MNNPVRLQTINYPEISHELLFIQRDDEIVITTIDGQEIASLSLETMERSILDERPRIGRDGSLESDPPKKWRTVPTKGFWLRFNAVHSETCREMADVYDNSGEYYDEASKTWIKRPYEKDN